MNKSIISIIVYSIESYDLGGFVLLQYILQTIIAGVIAPQSRWDDDGVKLRSAAVSLTVL